MSQPDVEHEEKEAKGAFYIAGPVSRAAEMTYSKAGESMIIVDHTEVGSELAGQGAGMRLLTALVQWAREHGVKVMATCPYALAQFRKHEELRDVFVG